MITMQAPAWYITWRSRFAPIRWRWTRVILTIHMSVAILCLALPLFKFIPNGALSRPVSSGGTEPSMSWGDLMFFAVVFGPSAIVMPTALLFAFKYQSWRSRARSFQGRMCGDCLHDLRGLGDAGKCPECGHPFSLDQLRRYWKGIHIPPTP